MSVLQHLRDPRVPRKCKTCIPYQGQAAITDMLSYNHHELQMLPIEKTEHVDVTVVSKLHLKPQEKKILST